MGRRFWQSNTSSENVRTFYVQVVEPLRRLQHRGVVEKLQEITATDDGTHIAVEIIGQVDLTKVSKQ
jgi:Mn-dependent DtxR family transcriptional regulator